jgi:hypothetical protein
MDEGTERHEHMPDQSDLAKRLSSGRVGVLLDGQPPNVAGGEVDWPLNPAASAGLEPK